MAENLDSGTFEGHVNLINWDKKNQNALNSLNFNDGRDAFLVMSSAYYDRTCLWSADTFTSVFL